MTFTNWLGGLRANRESAALAHNRGRRSRRGAAPRFRPQLEALEDRLLLSTLTVLDASDGDPGSLRAAIAAAGSGDTIVFDPSLAGQTMPLTSCGLPTTPALHID